MGPPGVPGTPASLQGVVHQEEKTKVSGRGSLETWGLGFNGMLTLFARLRMLLTQKAKVSISESDYRISAYKQIWYKKKSGLTFLGKESRCARFE